MPDAGTFTPLTAEQPWRGAAPYTEEDRAFFHGRRREVEELRHLLQRDILTVLTGAAGTGKTSLVRAGLLPSLSPDWLPVPIRIDWTAANEQRLLSRQVLEAIDAAARARPLDCPMSKPTDTLWEAFHRTGARWWNARQRVVTPVLVFDQFEEAFIAGARDATTRRHRDRFLDELSQLVANRPPSRVASRIEDGSEPEDAFDFGPVPVRVVLVLREEAADLLATLRSLFPTLGRSEFRLTAFTQAQARDVLIRSAAQRGLFAEGVVDQLLPRLSAGNDREHPFAPAKLSVQARELADLRAQRNATQITADFFLPTQPAPAPVAAKAEPPAESSTPAPRSSLPLGIAMILLACGGAWLFWQQRQPPSPLRQNAEAPALPEVVPTAEPASPAPVAESTPVPPPSPPAEPQPRVALTLDAPQQPPAVQLPTTLPASTSIATPAIPPPTTPLPTVPPPPTPLPSTPIPTPLPAPTPTPPPPSSPQPPTITTTILPPTPAPAPSSAIERTEPRRSAEPSRPLPSRRERVEREQPRRPATSSIVTPAPVRATPTRRPGYVPGGGG